MEWINIQCKMPPEHEDVLGYNVKYGFITQFHIVRYNNEQIIEDYGGMEIKIDYWMPLPEPPKD